MSDNVVERPTDLTAEWLTAAVGAGTITGFRTERIGTGQMSECYRIALTYADGRAGPESVVLKVVATDPVSRQTGLGLGLYEREVRFYTDIAPNLDGPIARCYHAGFDGGSAAFHLLLGDAGQPTSATKSAAPQSNRRRWRWPSWDGCTPRCSATPHWPGAQWLNRVSPMNQALIAQLYAGFAERYRDQIAPEHRVVCERLVAGFDAYLAGEAAPDRMKGLVHGDYRLDNMLFGEFGADRPLTVVDWQTVTWGPAMTDVAYFLGCALTVENRRTHYDTLLRAYHDALGPDPAMSLDQVRDGVRRQSFFGVTMAIVSPMLVERTERGDQLFMAMLQRHCQHVLDTDALAILPEPVAAEPLPPVADDEGAHPAGDEPLWNESWYFDFADPLQGIGGWVRLGLIPNHNTAWITVRA